MSLPDTYIVSYAQNREDHIIKAFFPDVRKGFYVDVGANDPQDDSVTKIFYDMGWSGINIEPNARLFGKLSKARERDINLAVGVSDTTGEIKFREYTNHGLSTFSENVKKQYSNSDDPNLSDYKDYKVEVRTLEDIFAQYAANKTINFMKVDVEGYEYEVLAGNDWHKYRPELLCIEANHINHDWRPLIEKAQYSLVFNDGLNEYYLRKESLDRQKFFDYADAMILSGIIVNPGVAQRIVEAEKIPSLSSDNVRLNEVNLKQKQEIAHLTAEITRYEGIRFLLRKLLARLYRKIFKPTKA